MKTKLVLIFSVLLVCLAHANVKPNAMQTIDFVTPEPVNEIVSLADAKEQLRVTEDFEDDLIQAYINAAVEQAEQFINGNIYQRTMVVGLDKFPTSLVLPGYPVTAISGIEYLATDAVDNEDYTSFSGNDFFTVKPNTKQLVIHFKEKPEVLADAFPQVKITAAVGYAIGKVPTPIIQAIKLMMTDFYTYREDRPKGINTAAELLLSPYRLPI